MNIGSLGLGTALNDGFNMGLQTSSNLAEYEKKRYLDESDQINQYQKNLADTWENHNRHLREGFRAPELVNEAMQAPLSTVDATAFVQQQQQIAPMQQQQVAQNTLGAMVANDPTATTQVNPYTTPPMQSPQQMSEDYYKYLQMTNGNVEQSLGGVVGYGVK